MSALVFELVSPSGRCNRKGLVILAVAMLGLEAVFGLMVYAGGGLLGGVLAISLKAVVMWMAIAAAAKRLHDIGRSAWWIMGGLAALITWSFVLTTGIAVWMGPEELARSSLAFGSVFAGTLLPALAVLLWLHFARGETGANAHGPVPQGLGFSR
ncbi:MAG: DUF805 domain-containing protein [Hyphomicrobiaceae bacterium]